MKRALLVALLVLIGALLFSLPRLLEAGGHDGQAVGAQGRGSTRAETDRSDSEVVGLREGSPDTGTGTRAATTQRAEIDEASAELAGALWVEGWVQFHEDTPLDEETWVVAHATSLSTPPYHRARVGQNGSFRLAFPAGTERGWIDLAGRYSYLETKRRLNPGSPPGSLTLRASLGALITGRLVLPPGVDARDADGLEVTLMAWEPSSGMLPDFERRSVETADLRFEFGGVEPRDNTRVDLEQDPFRRAERSSLQTRPGRKLEVVFELELGGRVAGVVRDPDGEPIEDADVTVRPKQGWSWMRPERTDAEGRFEIGGLDPVASTLTAKRSGYEDAQLEIPMLVAGRTLPSELWLGSGSSLAGTVTWPDAKPAAEGWIEWSRVPEEGLRRWRSGGTGRTALEADGSFEFTGLESGAYDLRAWALQPGEGPRTDYSGMSARERRAARKETQERPTWHAKGTGYPAGTSAIALVLEQGSSVHGRVVDDEGQPVERFTVLAREAENSGGMSRDDGANARNFRDAEDGQFTLDSLPPGSWKIVAKAHDHADAESQPIEAPGARGELVLVVPRLATVKGHVLSADGSPYEDARVTARSVRVNLSGDSSSDRTQTETDDEGAFELPVYPGFATLTASARDEADVQLDLGEVAPAAELEGYTLTLRVAGSIAGVVLGLDGLPQAERMVNMTGPDGKADWQRTDHEGAFRYEGLGAGSYRLQSQPKPKELADQGQLSGKELVRMTYRAEVDLAVGEHAQVTLALPAGGIALRGVVSAGGAPVARALVAARSGSRHQAIPAGSTLTDTEGRFGLELPQPGSYIVTASFRRGSASPASVSIQVPRGVSEFECQLELPSGKLQGRVVDSEGAAVPAATISVREPGSSSWQLTRAVSGADGRFSIPYLTPGTYDVEASYKSAQRGRVDGVLVTADPSDEIEIELQSASRLTGLVSDPLGAPVSQAHVTLVDAGGARLASQGLSDEQGRFELDGLPSGRFAVRARSEHLATSKPTHVDLASGSTASVDLSLSVGSMVLVRCTDSAGSLLGADVALYDSSGNDHAQIGTNSHAFSTSGDWIRIGPVTPDTYRLSATYPDGRSGVQTVDVDGRPELRVEVELR